MLGRDAGDARAFFHDDTLNFVPPLTDWCDFDKPLIAALGLKCVAGNAKP